MTNGLVLVGVNKIGGTEPRTLVLKLKGELLMRLTTSKQLTEIIKIKKVDPNLIPMITKCFESGDKYYVFKTWGAIRKCRDAVVVKNLLSERKADAKKVFNDGRWIVVNASAIRREKERAPEFSTGRPDHC